MIIWLVVWICLFLSAVIVLYVVWYTYQSICQFCPLVNIGSTIPICVWAENVLLNVILQISGCLRTVRLTDILHSLVDRARTLFVAACCVHRHHHNNNNHWYIRLVHIHTAMSTSSAGGTGVPTLLARSLWAPHPALPKELVSGVSKFVHELRPLPPSIGCFA